MDDRPVSSADKAAAGGELELETMSNDQLLAEILQDDDATDLLVEQVQVSALMAPLSPVTAIDHPPGRAVRQASFAPKDSWKEDRTRGHAQRLYYIADNGLEVSLGTLENPLDLEQARREIQKLGELTVLIDRLLFWYWNSRRRPRPGDGKVFIGANGSVPVTIVELLTMLGYEKHTKREYPEGKQRYTDGFRMEDKDRLKQNIVVLSAFQVQGSYSDGTSFPIDIKGAYLRYSLAMRRGVHIGYLISPGDWINTINLPDVPSLVKIDEQIFQFDKQREQHEIRLSLYLAERFRDQAKDGTLGQPLRVPVENQPDKYRYPTMEELLNGALIKIDRNNLTQRFAPRIEDALQVLLQKHIVGRAELVVPVDKRQSHWGKAWLAAPMLIQAPVSLVNEYRLLQQATLPTLPSQAASRRKKQARQER
jgi:hypothetical protein